MEESLPNMVDDRVKEVTKTQVLIYVAKGLILERTKMQAEVAQIVADAIQKERENLRAEITLQITNIKFEGLQASNTPCRPSAIRPRDQDNPHDDAYPEGENSAKRQKISEHGTYVFGESSFGQTNKIVQSCQRDPKAPAISLVNQDLLYLKKGNSRPEKIVLSLHKFPAFIFPNDDIEERTSRWVNLTALTITFPGIEKYKMFSIISEPLYGIIYKNNKKEKRVIRHQEIHKLCDATLKRVLKGLKSYNNDVKHGYVTPSLSKEDVEYLQFFEGEIKERFKHRDQMR
ncbi:hypothetical protein Tco_0642389 [Tanacetum coccineum]